MSPNVKELNTLFRQSARSALFSWQQNVDGLDELVSDMWVWYLERPGSQKKIEESDEPLARRLLYKAALQILAGQSLTEDEFRGNNLYSPENIKDALLGKPRNRFLSTVMPAALKTLNEQNPTYAEYIRRRYTDGQVPDRGPEQYGLSRALKALTKYVNILVIEAGGAGNTRHPGPKLRAPIDPELRSSGGPHADPTANMALALIDHPELRDDYFDESSLQDFLRGKGA